MSLVYIKGEDCFGEKVTVVVPWEAILGVEIVPGAESEIHYSRGADGVQFMVVSEEYADNFVREWGKHTSWVREADYR